MYPKKSDYAMALLFKYMEDAKLTSPHCVLSLPAARNKNIIFSVQVMIKQM